MAIVTGPWARALDNNADVMAGAKLRVKVAGSSTLASNIYSDAGMTTPHSNPITAVTGGWFPLIFAPSGQQYDIDLETSGGVVIRSFLNQEALGSDSGAWERDFTLSRARIAGLAGVTSFEGGPPTGDNIGGNVRLGGWNDTQADDLELDGAIVRTTSDVFTVNGKKLIGVVQVGATPFTTSSAVDIALSNTPSGIRAWRILVWDYLQSTNASLYGRLSYDSGATYKSGASDYYGGYVQNGSGTATAAAAQMDFCSNINGSAARPGVLDILVVTPNSGTAATRVICRANGILNTGNLAQAESVSLGEGAFGRATNLRLLPSAGTITGVYQVIGLRGTGD
jgi:hypothetical protein